MMDKWDRRFLGLAEEIATWSKDPSTKVGAVIIGKDRGIISYGYNGFPRFCCDNPEEYHDREVKYKKTVHAEVNAVLFARCDLSTATLYTTHPPCDKCAPVIIQAGIRRVVSLNGGEDYVSRWGHLVDESRRLFAEAKVEFIEQE